MDHNYEYRLYNIYLRPLQHADIEYLRIWRNEPDNTKYLNQVPYITEDMQEKWFRRYLDDKEEITFAIVEESIFHRIVGSLSLINVGEDTIEIGKVMVGDSNAHGMKVGTNAIKAAAIIAHEQLGKSTIFLHVYKANIPGVKAYENAGFRITDQHFDDQGRTELTMTLNY